MLGFGPISSAPISTLPGEVFPWLIFGTQYSVAGIARADGALDVAYAAEAGTWARGRMLQLTYAVEADAYVAGSLDVTFAVAAPVRAPGALDVAYATTGAVKKLGALDVKAAVAGVVKKLGALGLAYEVAGLSPQQMRLDIAYAVTAPARADGSLDVAYQVAAPSVAYGTLDAAWAVASYSFAEGSLDVKWYWNYVVARSLTLRWGGRVARSCVLDSTFLARVAKSCTLSHPLLTRVARSCTLSHPLLDHDKVARSLELRWSLLDDAAVYTPAAPTVTVRGQVLTVKDLDVSLEEGEVFWKCELELPDPDRQLSLFGPDEPFSVTLGTDVYDFIRQEPRYARDSAVERKASILGISPSAVHGRERAVLVTKTWKDATLASSILAELFGDDAPVLDGVLDWSVPADRLSVQNASPIEVAQQLARATGATLQAAPSGALSIRYLWPVAVPFLETATEDHVFDDARDVYTLSERVSLDRIVNRVRVLDVAEGAEGLLAAEIDSREDGYNAGRTSFSPGESPALLIFAGERVTLDSVRASAGNIAPLPAGEMDVTETLTFAGATEASLRYPTAALDAYTWLGNDLGAPELADETTVRIAAAGVGMLKVTYTTNFLARRLSGVPAQLGGEDEYDVLVLVEGTA